MSRPSMSVFRRRTLDFRVGSLIVVSLMIGAVSVVLTGSACADVPSSLTIEGYAGQVSYRPGEELTLHVSTTAANFSIQISRLGAKTEQVFEQSGIAGQESPIPENASSHGCSWPALWKMDIPNGWTSGYYHVRLSAQDGGGKYTHRGKRTAESSCFFIVRAAEPGKNSRVLIQLSTNTYNAYNNWGGFSLYAYNGLAGVQGNRVSFHRPPASQFNNWELPFVAWAEANGYTLDYAANNDLEFHPDDLKAYRLVLSVGHDEYWSAPMRDHLEAYITAGGNVAFFSGNTCCWQVRNEDQGIAQTCWKQRYVMDPLYPTKKYDLLSTLWSHHLIARPENQLTGVGFLHGGYHRSHGQFMDGSGAYEVHRPDHWLFTGTKLQQGSQFGSKDTIVGYECDGCEFTMQDGLPVPTGSDGTPKDFTILATCPAKWHPDDSQFYDRFPIDRVGATVLGTYTRGGTVVTAGATDWAHGLQGKDPVVEQITKNVFDQLGSDVKR